MSQQSFKDLLVWQKSIDLVELVYNLTRTLPKEEQFGLVSQMQRSAISIPSNIAEGKDRSSSQDFVRFLRIAKGSSSELETQIVICQRLYPGNNYEKITVLIIEIQKMLSGLINNLIK